MLSLNWKTMNNNVYVYRSHVIRFAFSAVLVLLHFVYALYSWLADQTAFAHGSSADADPWLDGGSNRRRDYDDDDERPGRLRKTPRHLVVSVCQEEVYYDRLAKVLAWALYLEVPVVSFYHNENGISPEELFFAFREQYGSQLLSKINWGLEFDDNIKFASKKRINGYKWEPRIEVNVLTSKHSKLQLVSALRAVCCTEEEFSSSLVESAINKTFPIVEPDLVVICGKSCTTFGLLPWHTRVTEFLTLKTHHNVTFSKFYNLLVQYSRREQRYGK